MLWAFLIGNKIGDNYELIGPYKNLKGIGPKRAELFHKLGIYTIEDLLHFYPRRYEDSSKVTRVSEAKIGEKTPLG